VSEVRHANARTALITGASVGIGREFARLLATKGFNLVLVARSVEGLNSIAEELRRTRDIRVEVIVMDLSEPGAALRLYKHLGGAGLQVDLLINNAGFGIFGTLAENDHAGLAALLQLNCVALTEVTRLFLPDMLARQSGYILNLSSTAAFQPGPLMAAYYASKAYVLSFTEAVAGEVRGSGVRVSVLCPGVTPTEFHAHANMLDSGLLKLWKMDAATVARAGFNGLMRGKVVIVPGALNKIHSVVIRFTPRGMARGILHWIQKRR
jgi:short-subunit dehydrogenase